MGATVSTGGGRSGTCLATLLALLLLSGLAALPRPASALTTVAILVPGGGEVWSAGTSHDLVWDLWTDSNNDVDAEYLVDGVPFGLIEQRTFLFTGRYTTPWTVPNQDLANVTIRACATDAVPVECATSPSFRIDGVAPVLLTRSPEGGNTGLADAIRLTFSEMPNATRLPGAFSLTPDPGNITWGVVKPSDTVVDHGPFARATTYTATISCGATDASDPGLPLQGCPVSWTFRTSVPPTFTFVSPAGGEVWTGGSTHAIRWTAADADEPASDLAVSLDVTFDGSIWSPLAGPIPGDSIHAWALPTVDSTARIRAEVVDTRGLNATAISTEIAIDSVAPRVSAVVPADGASGVGWSSPVTVELSEAVVGTLDAAAFSVREASGPFVPGALGWENPQRFRFTPAMPYEDLAMYIARLNATLRDASDPGNPMAAPFEWRFVTKPNRAPAITLEFAPDPVLSGGSQWTVAWSASDPDDLATLQVYLEFYDGDAFVPVAGPLPASGSFPWTAPLRDVLAASILVRAVDGHGAAATDAVTFAIDATPPMVTSATPPAGSVDVAPDTTIRITFSEPLDLATASVGLRAVRSGAWADLAASWDDPLTMRLTPRALLREMEAYELVINGTATDGSSPGNLLAAASWTFRIASFPPTLAVLEPAPGTRWSGGASQTIRVFAADGRDAAVVVHADLALDGTAFLPILAAASVANGERVFSIIPPTANAPHAMLRVCAADAAGAVACTDVPVAIDATRPQLSAAIPASGARQVHPEAPLRLTFSEPMNPASVESALSVIPAASAAFRWGRTYEDNDTLLVDHARFLELRTYSVMVGCTARDGSVPGLALAGACPLVWTFTTAAAPEVHLLYPIRGERLTGGVEHTLRWLAAEEEGAVRATVELSADGGATFPIRLADGEPFLSGEARSPKILPAIDTAAAVLRVTVRDTLGLAATATSDPFTIDATPPTVSVTPADGTPGASPLADLVLAFSESMDPASLAASLAVTPALRDPLITWTSTNGPHDTVRISHAAIRLGSAVRVSIAGMRDASRPGNAISEEFTFWIRPDRERPHPEIVVDPEATEGEVVVLDASASSDDDEIVDYVWAIHDADGRRVAAARGARVEYRAAAAGEFTVTVEVTDASGNRADASAPLYVHALGAGNGALPAETVTWLGWLALAGAGGSSAYSLTDRGRSFLSRTFLLPLYVRLKPQGILDQETRGMIRGYIRVNPGDSYTDMKRNLGLANGALAYHLSVLEREGIIQSTTKGARRLYYPADVAVPEDDGGLHEVQMRLLKHIEDVPGMSVHDLAGLLGVSSQLALYHVRKLAEQDLVRFERHGMKLRVFAPAADARKGSPERTDGP